MYCRNTQTVFNTILFNNALSSQRENKSDCVVGDAAVQRKQFLDLHYPIQRGIVTDWNNLSNIWHRCFYYETMGCPQESGVVVTCSVFSSEQEREKMTEILLETYEVPGLIMCNTAMLSAIHAGKTTATILNCGHQTIEAVPVVNLKAIPQAALKIERGGEELTQYMRRLFAENGTIISVDDAEIIKTKHGYVAVDFESTLQNAGPVISFNSDDGRSINCETERFHCPEALFRPSVAGWESVGIHELVFDSITKCDKEIQKELMGSIVPCGGCSLFPGLSDRLMKELTALVPSDVALKVIPPTFGSKYSSWIGASQLTSLKISDDMWISRDEYLESGPSIVHKKYC